MLHPLEELTSAAHSRAAPRHRKALSLGTRAAQSRSSPAAGRCFCAAVCFVSARTRARRCWLRVCWQVAAFAVYREEQQSPVSRARGVAARRHVQVYLSRSAHMQGKAVSLGTVSAFCQQMPTCFLRSRYPYNLQRNNIVKCPVVRFINVAKASFPEPPSDYKVCEGTVGC